MYDIFDAVYPRRKPMAETHANAVYRGYLEGIYISGIYPFQAADIPDYDDTKIKKYKF